MIRETKSKYLIEGKEELITIYKHATPFYKLWVNYPGLPQKIPAVFHGIDPETKDVSVRIVLNGIIIERAVSGNMLESAQKDAEWTHATRIVEI